MQVKVCCKGSVVVELQMGGVELNPGPNTSGALASSQSDQGECSHDSALIHDPTLDKQLLGTPLGQGQLAKRQRVATPQEEISVGHDVLDLLRTAVERIEAKLDLSLKETEVAKFRIEKLEQNTTQQDQLIDKLMQEVQDLKKKAIDLENRSREQNLVFFGLDTSVDTKPDECWDLITDFLVGEFSLVNIFIDRA